MGFLGIVCTHVSEPCWVLTVTNWHIDYTDEKQRLVYTRGLRVHPYLRVYPTRPVPEGSGRAGN